MMKLQLMKRMFFLREDSCKGDSDDTWIQDETL